MDSLPSAPAPVSLPHDDIGPTSPSPALDCGDFVARIHAGASLTGGAFTLVEEACPAGYATPLHVHRHEDEAFYVVEGTVTVFVGGTRVEAGAGAFLWGPRDVPHGFRVEGAGGARLLVLTTPSGFEDFIGELAALARSGGSQADPAALVASAARHGIEVLGALPD